MSNVNLEYLVNNLQHLTALFAGRDHVEHVSVSFGNVDSPHRAIAMVTLRTDEDIDAALAHFEAPAFAVRRSDASAWWMRGSVEIEGAIEIVFTGPMHAIDPARQDASSVA